MNDTKQNLLQHLFDYKMNNIESCTVNDLVSELIKEYNKLNISKEYNRYLTLHIQNSYEYTLGYKTEYGYDAIYNECNNYNFMKGFPVSDMKDAVFIILKNILWDIANRIECANRKTLQKEWALQYSISYDSRKYRFEYQINMLS